MTLVNKVIHGGLRVTTQGIYLGNIYGEGSITSGLNTGVGQNLSVNGTSSFTGLVTAVDLTSTGTILANILTTSGLITADAGLSVTTGGANITGDVDITGDLEVTDGGVLFKVDSLGLQSDGTAVVLTNLSSSSSVTGKALFIDDTSNVVTRFDNIYATAGTVYITGTTNLQTLNVSGNADITGNLTISGGNLELSNGYLRSLNGTYTTTGTKTLFTAGIGECWLISAWETGNLDAVAASDRVIAFIQTGFAVPITPDCIVSITTLVTVGLSISSTGATDTTIDITLVGIADTIEVSWTALRLL